MATPTRSCCQKPPATLSDTVDSTPLKEKPAEWLQLADKVSRVAFLALSFYYSPYVATTGFLAGMAFGFQDATNLSMSPTATLAACSQAFFERLAGKPIPDWMAFGIASAQLYVHITHHSLFSFIAAGMVGISAGSKILNNKLAAADVHLPATTVIA